MINGTHDQSMVGILYFIFFILCTAFAGAQPATSSPPADSAYYWKLRSRIPDNSANSAILQTSDVLAGEGLYREAIDICISLIDTSAIVSDTGTEASPEKNLSRTWRVALGLDYYNLQDFDTQKMTKQELRDFERLTESPLAVWIRASCEIDRKSSVFRKLTPHLYIANYRSNFKLPALFSLFNDKLTLESTVKAGKWFQEDASGNMWIFLREDTTNYEVDSSDGINIRFNNPAKSYSSDMGGATMRLSPEYGYRKDRRWQWQAPLEVDWEHFNRDRNGYESLVEYRFSPSLEYRGSGSLSPVLRCAGEADYEDYYRSESDGLDVFHGMLNGEGSVRYLKNIFHLKAEWLYDNYPNASSPGIISRLKGSVRYENGQLPILTPRLTIQTIHENNTYRRIDTTDAFTLSGEVMTIRPSIRFNLSDAVSLEPEGRWERRWSDLRDSDSSYIWWALSSWEGSLRGALSLHFMDLACIVSYRWEQIDPAFDPITLTTDNRNISILVDGGITFCRYFAINLLFDYQYRIYAPFDADCRKTSNITGSMNASVTW